MKSISNPSTIQEIILEEKIAQSVGFVPTMGCLHKGHLSLVHQSLHDNDVTVVSIFVNPTQFGPGEDFDQYPRISDKDTHQLESLGVDFCFCPSDTDIYPLGKDTSTNVHIPMLSAQYCGQSRPHHFDGVTSIVTRLLHIIPAHHIYMGEKDFQQSILIQRLISDLFIPTTLHICPIIRNDQGLALSSRNRYLSKDDQKKASLIYQSLSKARTSFHNNSTQSSQDLIHQITHDLTTCPGISIDYLHVVDPSTLTRCASPSMTSRLLFAGHYNDVRLIDTISLAKINH